MGSRRVFISYKRNTGADEPLADRLHRTLAGHGHVVFIDRGMLVGEDWVRRIQREIEAADCLVVLLSEASIQSAMVAEEVRMAYAQLGRSGGRQPRVLPIRVGFEGQLPYDLGALLNRLNYALWRGPEDDERVFSEIGRALADNVELPAPTLAGGDLSPDIPLPAANPRAELEAPEGTMAPESPFYVGRPADAIVVDEQRHAGFTLTIQAPRQMGKSSLLGRVMAHARDGGKRVAFIDFQAFGHAELRDPQLLYHQFCFLIEDALELPSELDRYWSVPLAPAQKCRRFMERRVLPVCQPNGLLLALDEADALLDAATSSDFFGMLRSWHNERALAPAWRNFSLAMVISTEPHMLIDNVAQSPFNVGTNVKPEDFSLDETRRASASHGAPIPEADLGTLQQLLGGHPYLTRKALYLVSRGRHTMRELLDDADSETGPFGDHLRALLAQLQTRPMLADAMRSAVRSGTADGAVRHRLIAGGLVREKAGRLIPRNGLYGTYFRRVL